MLWLTLDGPLATEFLAEMNSLTSAPAKQGFLPSQVILAQQIVQVLVRQAGTGDASFQLGQLLWGLLAAHSGQSVAMSATLSHEIARVVDALRRSEYKEASPLPIWRPSAACRLKPSASGFPRSWGCRRFRTAVLEDGARQASAAHAAQRAPDRHRNRHATIPTTSPSSSSRWSAWRRRHT